MVTAPAASCFLPKTASKALLDLLLHDRKIKLMSYMNSPLASMLVDCYVGEGDIADLDNGSKGLKAVGVNHGDMLYMLYRCECVCVCVCVRARACARTCVHGLELDRGYMLRRSIRWSICAIAYTRNNTEGHSQDCTGQGFRFQNMRACACLPVPHVVGSVKCSQPSSGHG
eukprot:1139201-Pelagomonas_calceolata.AAC.1